MPERIGILIVGHGTRDSRGVAEFVSAAQMAAEQLPDFVVEHAFLELAEPTIQDAVEHLARAGIQKTVIAPMLLFAAGHAKEDIPRLAATATRNLAMSFCQAEPLGCHQKIVAASAERFRQATNDLSPDELRRTLLILVGRGSSDPLAVAELHRFAELPAARAGLGGVEVAFIAVADPLIRDLVAAPELRAFTRVVVQPHLLFRGQVLQSLRDIVDSARADSRQKSTEWLVTDHIGPCRFVAEALAEQCLEAVKCEGF
jgi:sirohydrochlorin cobaltochelatase